MTKQMEEIVSELVALYRQFSYDDMARYFEAVRAEIAEGEGNSILQKDTARGILSAYRGMGSLNDQVIMVHGKVDYEASSRLDRLLTDLRSLAIEIATRRTD